MKTAILDLLSSKKFLVMIATMIAAVAGRVGFDLDQTSVVAILVSGVGYMTGQGLADFGKEKAKVEAGTDSPGD